MTQLLTRETLRKENLAFVGTGGVSQDNHAMGFVPAFYDVETGCAEIARCSDGRPAPMHSLDELPVEWITERDAAGRVTAIKNSVITGFIRGDYFYTRTQAAEATLN